MNRQEFHGICLVVFCVSSLLESHFDALRGFLKFLINDLLPSSYHLIIVKRWDSGLMRVITRELASSWFLLLCCQLLSFPIKCHDLHNLSCLLIFILDKIFFIFSSFWHFGFRFIKIFQRCIVSYSFFSKQKTNKQSNRRNFLKRKHS